MELGIRICIMLTNQRTHRIQGWPEPIIYGVYAQYFWQENHQIQGHIRCTYTVLVNPTYGIYMPFVIHAINVKYVGLARTIQL